MQERDRAMNQEADFERLWEQCTVQRADLAARTNWLEASLDAAPTGMLLFDGEERLVHWNPIAARVLGMETIEAGMASAAALIERFAASIRPAEAAELLATIVLGQSSEARIDIESPAPATIVLRQNEVTPEPGRRLGRIVTLDDVTEAVRMRRDVEDLAQLPQVNPFPVMRVKASGTVTYSNPACLRFAQEAGVSVARLGEVLLSGRLEVLGGILEKRISVTEFRVETLGRILQLTMAPFSSRDEVFLTIFDASERERAQKQLEAKAEELSAAYMQLSQSQSQLVHTARMATLGAVAAGVAHEINTPAGVIASNSSTLAAICSRLALVENTGSASPPPGDGLHTAPAVLLALIQELAATITLASGRIAGTVRSLKDFVRLDEAPIGNADLHDCLETTLSLLRNRLADRIDVVRDYQPLPAIECVPSHINQVFMNMLLNAIDAMPQGGTIRIGTRLETGFVSITISDTGPGIPPGKLSTIFEPSFVTRGARVEAALGLSICRKIVLDHGGEITASSEPGRHTTFAIRLPVTLDPETRRKLEG